MTCSRQPRSPCGRRLRTAGLDPTPVGHVHAHGVSTTRSDAEEAQAIEQVFGARAKPIPVTAAKSYLGNAGAACGVIELIASVLALQHGQLFPVLNYETPDPDCPINVVAILRRLARRLASSTST